MSLIQVSVNQNKIAIDPRPVKKAAKEILNALDFTDAELSIVIVDDDEMTRLNREYRRGNTTTDVLAFAMTEGEFGDVCPQLLGDVVISAPTARLMSLEHGCSLSSILDLLLVHGILHLVGHDHEAGKKEAREMQKKTLEILRQLGHAEESFDWFLGPSSTKDT